MPLFQTIHSFITVLLLVIDEINYYLTRNNTYYHGVTTVTTANTPNIKTKIVQKMVDLFVLAVSKNAISGKEIIMKYIFLNLKNK